MAGNKGAGALGFFGGFSKGLAGSLAQNRERRDREARERTERRSRLGVALLPEAIKNAQTPEDLIDVFSMIDPDFNKGGAQSGMSRIGPYLTGVLGQQDGDVGQAPSVGPIDEYATVVGGGGPVTVTKTPPAGVPAPVPTAPRRSFMGVELGTPEEKAERAAERDITTQGINVAARRKFAETLKSTYGLTDAEARRYILTGDFPSATSAAAMRPQSVRGMINGEPAFGIFDPTTKSYLDPETGQPLKGFTPLTSAATQQFGVDRESLAKAVFDKPFRELTSQEASIVLREEKDMLQKEASSRALGTGQGRFQAPIDVKTAQETGLPTGISSAQVAGQVVPTMQQIDRSRSVMQLQEGLTDIRDRLLVALPKEKELGGLAPGVAFALRRRLPQYRNDIAKLESAINNVVNVMARSVGEQRGTQTERDALRAEAAIAQIRDAVFTGDTQESATARINESLGVLSRILTQLPKTPTPTGAPGAATTTPGASGAPAAGTPPPRRKLVPLPGGGWGEP